MRERRDNKDPEVKQEVQRYIDTRLYNVPYPFFAKDVIVELKVKLENILLSESKGTAVRQKEIKLNKKDRSANAIMLRRRYINHPQK